MKYIKLFESFDTRPMSKEEDWAWAQPPKWVKNPKSWAMDKIVTLFTPESNIHQISTFYVEGGVFEFKELDKVKSFIKSIYQSSKDKNELDVYDHVRRFDEFIWQNNEKIDWDKVEKYSDDKNSLLRKFHGLLSIIKPT